MNKIICDKCKKIFAYEISGAVYPGGKEKEEIQCPYCNHINGYKMTSGFVYVYKVDEKGNIERK